MPARLFDPRSVAQSAANDDAAVALAHGLYWLALNVAEVRPVVVAVDDPHWADAALLRWVSYPPRRLEAVCMGALVTVRGGGDEDPGLAELLVDPATTIARLPPLTAPGGRRAGPSGHRSSCGELVFVPIAVRRYRRAVQGGVLEMFGSGRRCPRTPGSC